MKTSIYCLSDPRDGRVRYIGKSINPANRLTQHRCARRRGYVNNWLKSLRLEGIEPVMDIIEEIESENDSDWVRAERFWIVTLRFLGCNLTNLTDGGDGLAGHVHTQATRAKLRAFRLGRKEGAEFREKARAAYYKRSPEDRERSRLIVSNPSPETRLKLSSWKRSKELCEKISASKLGKPRSAECKVKLSIANTGKTLSEGTRAKLSKAHTGKKFSAEHLENIKKAAFQREAKRREQRSQELSPTA